jgi:hypothetical protein
MEEANKNLIAIVFMVGAYLYEIGEVSSLKKINHCEIIKITL